jgi:peptidoglycan/LPS O-acetylase OafA/YrhL
MLASSQKPVFRDLANLDFIRSFAVLLVVGSHLLSYTNHGKYSGWSGMTGVCIFFVHTSLVLMFSMERDPHIGRFYLRRIFRIYPLWLVVLAGVLIFHPSIDTGFPVNPRHVTLVDTLAQMTLTPNLFGLGTVYVPAGWTLPLEVQMYIFLPVLFFLVRSRNQLWVLMVIDVFIMAYDRANLPAFYSGLPMCVPYFLPGVMAFVLWKRAKRCYLAGCCRLRCWRLLLWTGSLARSGIRGASVRSLGFRYLSFRKCLFARSIVLVM